MICNMIEKSGCVIDLEVDGGVDVEWVVCCIEVGVDVLVVGMLVFCGGFEKYVVNIVVLRGG